ncbi:hypothetical protein QPK87_08820 [Kamptonema cortianum]|uniref:Uncharacterized protein n=1 Tax=Geitlerinema calcuttense NRMC-F 0142 TaxID=2922238 RepID=A0ABT7LX93_9CYAN|nr:MULTISPECIES: hypothetical protein [Cyanophyceae]MDK3156677.1 hypothetical protein [Kamptonema cortianum]MDL5050314.1 hypothetical protein [Oscillatoria amoena NRMC-F 0135]MDL5055146.1 hypothetical protein [Oscillatoria laete-virens NRMC-F 0139]MDL5056632.1 hypothetical protein [Geitlerinema calcuttense NRMC-F 0142]
MRVIDESSIIIEFPDTGHKALVNYGSLVVSLRQASETATGENWIHAESFARALLEHFISNVQENMMTLETFEEIIRFVLRKLNLEKVADHFHYIPAQSIIDLDSLTAKSGVPMEIEFYDKLRRQVAEALATHPQALHIRNIRKCVKTLRGAKRWRKKCHRQHDELVEFIRQAIAAYCEEKKLAVLIN